MPRICVPAALRHTPGTHNPARCTSPQIYCASMVLGLVYRQDSGGGSTDVEIGDFPFLVVRGQFISQHFLATLPMQVATPRLHLTRLPIPIAGHTDMSRP